MKLELIPKVSFMRPNFITLEDVYFEGDVVPAGLITDLASVPRVLWLIVPSIEYDTAPCAVMHDDKCNKAVTWQDRLEGDQQFYRFLRKRGVNPLKSYIMYAGVRLGALWWFLRK